MEHQLGPHAPLVTCSHYCHVQEQPYGALRRRDQIRHSKNISVRPADEPINLIACAVLVGVRARLRREQSSRGCPQSGSPCHPSLAAPLLRRRWILSAFPSPLPPRCLIGGRPLSVVGRHTHILYP